MVCSTLKSVRFGLRPIAVEVIVQSAGSVGGADVDEMRANPLSRQLVLNLQLFKLHNSLVGADVNAQQTGWLWIAGRRQRQTQNGQKAPFCNYSHISSVLGIFSKITRGRKFSYIR
jgi:hypothetical protein